MDLYKNVKFYRKNCLFTPHCVTLYVHLYFIIMKKNYFFAGAIITALITVITIVNFLFNHPQKTPPAIVSTAMITPLSSQVFSSLPLKEITKPTTVELGKRIITSATGRALIEATHTTVIDANTEISLATLNPTANQTELELHTGNLWSRVKKISDQGEYFDIVTDNARASVRGTSFGVFKKDRITTLIVIEGSVLFGPKNGPQIVVPAGKKSFVIDSNPAIITEISEEDAQNPWFIFNNPNFARETAANTVTPTTTNSSSVEFIESATTLTTQKHTVPVATEPQSASNATEPTQETIISEPPSPVTPASPSTDTQPTTTPSAVLTSIFPNTARYGDIVTITLTGKNFITSNVTGISIGTLTTTSFSKISESRIQFSISTRQLGPGTYSVSITDANKSRSTLTSAFTITETTVTNTTSTTTKAR